MIIKAINAGLSVSPQVLPEDISAIAAAGFRSVMCNRPDGGAAARAAGLEAAYLAKPQMAG